MAAFYVYLLVVGLLGVFGDQLTTGLHALQGVRIAGDPGKFERNKLPRYFLRRLGPRIGPAAYIPVELLLVVGLPAVLYDFYTTVEPGAWAVAVLGQVLLFVLAGTFLTVVFHNIRWIVKTNAQPHLFA